MPDFSATAQHCIHNPIEFIERVNGLKLRRYQVEVAQAIIDSVRNKRGDTIVVLFPRQSGKNELQAQIESYLLTLYSRINGEIIKVSPTWKPQSLNAMRRLERVLKRNIYARTHYTKESGYIYRVETSRIYFLSGSPEASIVGATASTLLEVDEAQDVLISKFDKDIGPMAASTNATRVFWGTAWTSRTLLARELRAAQVAERTDGRPRVFIMTADQVGAEVPAYKKFVAEQIQKLGRMNPMVRTQYFSEEIDAEAGMFPDRRQALMAGEHRTQRTPPLGVMLTGPIYALLIDVAGEDEGIAGPDGDGELASKGRDSTTVTVIRVDLDTLSDPIIKAPTYRVVQRHSWTGVKHTTLYSAIRAIADTWHARHVVIDATGVGAGLASFLDKALPGRVIPFVFNSATKSKLGWDFLSIIETGRFKDYADMDSHRAAFQLQMANCQLEILPGPNRTMRWSVPDGTRDPGTGELVHDDYILSAALCAVLDDLEWSVSGPPVVSRAADPLAVMDKERGF